MTDFITLFIIYDSYEKYSLNQFVDCLDKYEVDNKNVIRKNAFTFFSLLYHEVYGRQNMMKKKENEKTISILPFNALVAADFFFLFRYLQQYSMTVLHFNDHFRWHLKNVYYLVPCFYRME